MALKITSLINSDSGQTSAAYVRIKSLSYDANSQFVEVNMAVYINQAASVDVLDTIVSKAVKTRYTMNNITTTQFENNFTITKVYTLVKNQLISSGLTVIDA
jgi:hypothetical protein